MSQSDSFVNEVSEDVRRDSLRRGFARYGWILALLALGAIGTAGVMEWRAHGARIEAEKTGDALRAAYLETDPAKRAEALAGVAAQAPDAAAIARLAEAGSQIEAGNTDAAATTLAALADDGAAPPLYRSLAALQRVMVLGPRMETSERLATLETLAANEAPFQPLALEQRALARLDGGDTAGALDDLNTILTLPLAPEQLLGRARQLILAAGGSLPATRAPAAADAAEDAPGDAPEGATSGG